MKKNILIFILFISSLTFIFCEESNMKINLTTYDTKYDNIVLLTAEQPLKRFSLKREAGLCQGIYWCDNFYLEKPSGTGLSEKDYVSKIEYDKNPKKYPKQDIIIKILPVGTEFELVKVEIDVWRLGACHYWIKLINDPEYKDILIDAVALTNVDDNFAFNPSWWKFIEYEKIDGKLERKKIIVEKVPMFKGKWAKEIKEKK
jgi:hypothetical protein